MNKNTTQVILSEVPTSRNVVEGSGQFIPGGPFTRFLHSASLRSKGLIFYTLREKIVRDTQSAALFIIVILVPVEDILNRLVLIVADVEDIHIFGIDFAFAD